MFKGKTGMFRAGLGLLVVLYLGPALTEARHQPSRDRDRDLTSAPAPSAEGLICPAFPLKSQNGGNPGNIEEANNDQVLTWKATSKNQFHARARVSGPIVRVYPDRNGHEHFSIQIGSRGTDTIEIVYNQAFGAVPNPTIGTMVEACGDYITSTGPSPAPGGKTYPASPDGAIVHWVHAAPARSGHTSGYLIVGGVLTGRGIGHLF